MIIALALVAIAQAQPQTWLLEQEVVTQTKDPHPLSKAGWKDISTWSTSIVRWRDVDGELQWTETTCAISTPPVLGIRTEYTDRFIAAIPTPSRSADWDGKTLRTSVTTTLLGALDTDLTQITDADGDGNPGVTVHVSHPLMGRGEVYVAQTATSHLSGSEDGSGRIRGSVYVDVTQRILGASRWWLKHQPPVRPHPDSERSWFELTSLPEGSDCTTVSATGPTPKRAEQS